jgi:DNA-directed RNA polymerase specialized sigma24 family protein
MTAAPAFADYPFPHQREYASQCIRQAALRICHLANVPLSEIADLEQTLHVELLKRQATYDPGRSQVRTYIDRVVRSAAISEVRKRCSRKRSVRSEAFSLDEHVRDEHGREVPRYAITPQATTDPWPQVDLTRDMALGMRGLTKLQQEVAQLLATNASDLTVARTLRITMLEVATAKRCIHIHFDDLGLRAYLGDR